MPRRERLSFPPGRAILPRSMTDTYSTGLDLGAQGTPEQPLRLSSPFPPRLVWLAAVLLGVLLLTCPLVALWLGWRGHWLEGALLVGMVGVAWFFLPWIRRREAWRLADGVWDEGRALRIRRGRVELVIPLRSVLRLHDLLHLDDPRVRLVLRKPSDLGQRIDFIPACKGWLRPGRESAIRDLAERLRLRELRRSMRGRSGPESVAGRRS